MNAMIKIYADLIIYGYKTIEQVPEKIREDVSKYLGHDIKEEIQE